MALSSSKTSSSKQQLELGPRPASQPLALPLGPRARQPQQAPQPQQATGRAKRSGRRASGRPSCSSGGRRSGSGRRRRRRRRQQQHRSRQDRRPADQTAMSSI
jgi:hypothetical protein